MAGRREKGGDGGCRENDVHQDGEREPVLAPQDREEVGQLPQKVCSKEPDFSRCPVAWAVPSQTQLWGSSFMRPLAFTFECP